jgi:deazaflavin-dependent oxidoreductase (nitroreductase family)
LTRSEPRCATSAPSAHPPNLLLHTTGAKTGQARTTSVAYSRDGDAYLIVASKGGDPRSPGWYYNLKANPDVEINVGPKRFGVTARPVRPGLRPAVADRQQELQRPLRGLPAQIVAADPGPGTDSPLRVSPEEVRGRANLQ